MHVNRHSYEIIPGSMNSPFAPKLPQSATERLILSQCSGSACALALTQVALQHPSLLLVVARDVLEANQLEGQMRFFSSGKLDILQFPDWETLPYDLFSPLPELVSQRLLCLHRLRQAKPGVLIVPVATLMQRILPPEFLDANVLLLEVGARLNIDELRRRLEKAGYQAVPQVMAHGEFAVRGSLVDLFPMGADSPYRVDLFDDEIDSIRLFDPESQRSGDKIAQVKLLPAHEFPVDEAGISHFRQAWRNQFDADPKISLVYQDVSQGQMPGGIEYYLPLFFDQTATLFDYLPSNSLAVFPLETAELATQFMTQVEDRYEQRAYDIQRPILKPKRLFLEPEELAHWLKQQPGMGLSTVAMDTRPKGYAAISQLDSLPLPPLALMPKAAEPEHLLKTFLGSFAGKALFVAESAGRREHLLDTLRGFGINPAVVSSWGEFLNSERSLCLTVGQVEHGFRLTEPPLALIPEAALLGERVRQSNRKRKGGTDAEAVIRNLAELNIGSPVVHEEHGVGRYLGLQTLSVGGLTQEFLTLEYAKGDKLYVPVSALHLISRYQGAADESAPLHKLGSDQWEKARRKAAEKARDVAAELLEIYARREDRQGFSIAAPDEEYARFAAAFEFEETPDQAAAIEAVIEDMCSKRPMDRLVCGDVGFGKTEVAMRAAFLAAQGGKQVAVLVPTTLLAQQHYENFIDRFADWPVRIESLSRFNSAKEAKQVLVGLEEGQIDIVVGTHKLLSDGIKFKDLGLVIIDEEHRFGVRHKEKLKSLRAEVDVLTLTATPIPRTLNLAMSQLRDLSIIATPPLQRHPIQTFAQPWNDALVSEACQRELKRGGQVYVLHNEVDSIARMAETISKLVPGARVQYAHGQMRERQLEQIMRDFYHQRFNVLVSTTIIESGIDVPSANTIIINRADKLGLAQLHQLRGRVGRSHHRAYCYLITPPPKAMTPDALKRIEALVTLDTLGAGFSLATHDLEIRGAGELLGESQSGQMIEIGFTLYTQLLERAVAAIRQGKAPELDRPLDHGTEIELNVPSLLPDDYLPDVHMRLIQYKRIASATSEDELTDLRIEMIDRFGLLPPAAKNLFEVASLKIKLKPFGIRKIEAGPQGGKILFEPQPNIDPLHIIRMVQIRPKQFKLDGNDKLRFFFDLSDTETRVEKVAQILQLVIGKTQ